MPQRFSVELLTAEEYDAVVASDARYVNAADSLGFADPDQGVGYARLTAWPELNKFLVNHEFEHLLSPENGADRDEHGIYHKKVFKEIILPVGGAALGGIAGSAVAPGIGTAIGAGLGGGLGSKLGGASTRQALTTGLLSGAAPAIAGGISKVGSALKGGLSSFGKGLSGGGAGAAITGAAKPAVGAATRGASPSVLGGGASSVGGLAKRGILDLPSVTGSIGDLAKGGGIDLSSLTQSAADAIPGLTGAASASAPVAAGASSGIGSTIKNLLSKAGSSIAGGIGQGAANSILGQFGGGMGGMDFGDIMAGTAIAGIPYTGVGPQTPDVPNLRELPGVRDFASRVEGQLGPLSERAKGLSSVALPQDMTNRIRQDYDRYRAEVTSQFKAFRPGADLATDSAYRQAMSDIERQEGEDLTQAQFEFQGNERQNILAQLGVDQELLGQLGALAQLDIDTIMMQTGLDANEAQQFRDIFGSLGGLVATRGMSAFRQPEAAQRTR